MGTLGLRKVIASRATIRIVAGLAIIVAAAVGSGPVASADTGDHRAIVTESGPLKGMTVGGVKEYLGIPYAAPPVGSLRWTPPQSFGKWHGVFRATQFSSDCPQSGGGNEDCLFLNVYTPKAADNEDEAHGRGVKHHHDDKHGQGRAVMVWIHGGGLTGGGADQYDPSPLVNGGHVIVVTINYRLGLLGFFAHPALDAEGHLAGNYGFTDQQFALGWVQRNIAAFGGDPKRVTIFGESAGGQSIYSQLASPLAAGLFSGAIAESGSYAGFEDYTPWIVPIATGETSGTLLVPAGTTFATLAGCGSQTAACLRGVPAANFASIQPFPMYPFIDGSLLAQDLGDAFNSGKFNKVPVISGTNHDEYRLFVALDFDLNPAVGPLSTAGYAAAVDALFGPFLGPIVLADYPLPATPPADAASIALGASVTDAAFSCAARRADQALAQFVPTYTYEFNDENAPFALLFPPLSFPLGASHFAEVQYLLDYLGTPAPFTANQEELSDAMISYWTRFAKHGDPNSAAEPVWSPYSATTDEFQSFVPPTPVVESSFASDHMCSTLWDFL